MRYMVPWSVWRLIPMTVVLGSWVLVVLAILAPVLEASRSGMSAPVYGFLSYFCHQRPSRSWFLLGSNLGLCVRDFCLYATLAVLGTPLAYSSKGRSWITGLRPFWGVLLITPLLFDGSGQLAGLWTSTNILRAATGVLAGIGVLRLGLLPTEASAGWQWRVALPRRLSQRAVSCLIIFTILLSTSTLAQGPPAKDKVTLKAGTPVFIVFPDGVSGDKTNPGQSVSARVLRDVKVEDVAVIAAGARVTAQVVDAKKASGWGQSGTVSIRVDGVEAVDGQYIPLSASQRGEGDTATGTAVATGVITGVICLPLALTGFLIKGDEGVIRPGTEAKAFTDAEAKIQPK